MLVLTRLAGYVAVVFVELSPMGANLSRVQLGLFGVLLGGAFAPQPQGRPIVPRNARIDFLRRHVLMSRGHPRRPAHCSPTPLGPAAKREMAARTGPRVGAAPPRLGRCPDRFAGR